MAKDKNSIYIVKVNFSKFVAFKGIIRKILNMVADHIEGPRHICLFEILFSCQCPLLIMNSKSPSLMGHWHEKLFQISIWGDA
jgi:hypothetical protein